MAKLYIFGIGGTGSRVLRSLTFLLGAGVKLPSYSEVVPIVVDADSTSGDKTETVQLMENYQRLYQFTDHTSAADPDGFFATSMSSCCHDGFTLNIPGGTAQKFKDYMHFSNLDNANRDLVKMLFSEKNLEADMSVGFKGNPNIGSVVLNQFIDSDDFAAFANSFAEGDAIFIISSIFGGTGASGFPILLKNLRANDTANVPNANLIAQAPIGAISVLPYFILDNVDPNRDDQIDSGTFIQKTRAALKYYERNLAELDHMYYIGDDVRPTYDNHDGGALQKNKPNFVEFVAALSIFDFANQACGGMTHNANSRTMYHEYGIKEDKQEFNFSNLSEQSVALVRKPMAKLLLAHNYFTQALDQSWNLAWASTHEPVFSCTVLEEGGFWERLTSFTTAYKQWLNDMANNKRQFGPFKLTTGEKDVFAIVSNKEPKKIKVLSYIMDDNFKLFNNKLDSFKKKKDFGKLPESLKTPAAYWLNLFSLVTSNLIEEKLKI